MRAWTFLIFVVAPVYIINVDAAPEMPCKDFTGSLTKRQLGGISTCTKSLKFKNAKEKASKMNCILKCVLQKEGVLNAGSKFDEAALMKFIDTEIPPNLKEKAVPLISKCVEAASTADPNEEMCKTYDPLIKCMLTFIGDVCK